MIPCVPLSVPYLFFISFASSFSFFLSSRNCVGSMPQDGNSVMCVIISTSIKTILSNQMSPACVNSNNCLTQPLVYYPLPKCGRSKRPKIPIFSNPFAHWSGWSIGSPTRFMPTVSKYTLFSNSTNLSMSITSWSNYFIFSTYPRKPDSTCTQSGICSKMRVVTGCLRGDLSTFCLYFFSGGWLEVPMTIVFTSEYHFGQSVTYYTIPSSGWSDTVV
jgi:hypothetical protein